MLAKYIRRGILLINSERATHNQTSMPEQGYLVVAVAQQAWVKQLDLRIAAAEDLGGRENVPRIYV
jgi:hypothetical protein